MHTAVPPSFPTQQQLGSSCLSAELCFLLTHDLLVLLILFHGAPCVCVMAPGVKSSSLLAAMGDRVVGSDSPCSQLCLHLSAFYVCKMSSVFLPCSRTLVTRWAVCYGASSPSARKSQVGVSQPPPRVSTSSSFPTTARRAFCGRSCAMPSA